MQIIGEFDNLPSARIPQMDWAGRTEGHGNAGETAGSFFHPSDPSEFGYLIQRKDLILQSKWARGADRMLFHPVNPGSAGSGLVSPSSWSACEISSVIEGVIMRKIAPLPSQ